MQEWGGGREGGIGNKGGREGKWDTNQTMSACMQAGGEVGQGEAVSS